jgi:peptide/nickel transport system substrate-binding protein
LRFVESVSAVDDQTVVIRFDRAYPEQFFDAVYHVHILPRHILGDVPHDELAAHGFARSPIGSGPYRFVQWNAAEFIELAGNEDYHRGRPNLPRVIWRFAANPPQAMNQLLAGEADVLNPITRQTDFDRVENATDLRLIAYPYNVYVYIGFNLRDPDNLDQPHPLFGDVQARRALAELVDTEAIVRGVIGSLGSRGVGPLTSLFGELHDALSPVVHDAQQALASLRSLGWADSDDDGILDKDGQPFEFGLLVPNTSVGRMQSAEVIQAQLRESGIRMNIIEADMNSTFASARSGRFDAVFGALQHDPSPSSLVDSWTEAGFAGNNYGHYASSKFDDLVERAQSAGDPDNAKQLWQEAFQTIIDDAPAIWVYEPNFAVGIHRRFEDVTIRPDQWSVLLPQWRIDPQNFLARDVIGRN